MRDIRFRAWVKDENRMFDVTKIDFPEGVIWDDGLGFVTDVIKVELMQFTGLEDVNGREIYEGDIIEFEWVDEKEIGKIKYGIFDVEGGANTYPQIMGFYIEYNRYKTHPDGENMFGLVESLADVKCKVIGNIYENGDLLK